MTPKIRVANLNRLLRELKIEGVAGSYAELARVYEGIDASYISQVMNGTRNLGERAARSLEKKLNLEPFYLDRTPDNSDDLNAVSALESSTARYVPIRSWVKMDDKGEWMEAKPQAKRAEGYLAVEGG